jgi:hypothetical protein
VAPEFSIRGIYEDEFCWSGADLEAFVAESIGTQVALPENKRIVVATNFDVGPVYYDTVMELKRGLTWYLEFMRNLFP